MLTDKRLKAGAGSAVIHFPVEVFPTDGLCGVHDDPCARCGRGVGRDDKESFGGHEKRLA